MEGYSPLPAVPQAPRVPVPIAWDRRAQRFPPGFYTYRLLDPRDGLAFYVGKGCRGRAWQHDSAVKRGDLSGNQRKVTKIQEIIARGGEIEIDIVACYELESDALDHEFRLVDASPTLTNIAPGGGGAPLSQADQARKAALRQEKMRRLRAAERIAAEKSEFQKRCEALLAKAKSSVERAQIQGWIDGLDEASANKILRPFNAALRLKERRSA